MRFTTVWPALVLLLPVLQALSQPALAQPDAASSEPASSARETTGDAQIIVIDPATGRASRDPALTATAATTPAAVARYNQAFDDLQIEVHPDGSESVDISGLPRTPLVAEIIGGQVVVRHAREPQEPIEEP